MRARLYGSIYVAGRQPTLCRASCLQDVSMWRGSGALLMFCLVAAVGATKNRQPSAELLQFMTGDAPGRRRGSAGLPPGKVEPSTTAALSRAEPRSAPPGDTARPDPAVRRFISGDGKQTSSRRPPQPAVQTPAQVHKARRLQNDVATARMCNLRSVDARTITQSQFREQYQGREPVLLTHVATGWVATTTWATTSLIAAAHGNVQVHLQNPVLLAEKGTFAPVVSTLPLSDYLDPKFATEQQPFFQNRWHSLTDRLLTEVNFSHVPMRSVRSHHIFSLGGNGTGVGFHSHVESWLAQVQGRKHWSLARSLGPGWQLKHGCTWISEEAKGRQNDGATDRQAMDAPWYMEMLGMRKRPHHQCVVHPGDAIYIPTGWYHATCNLDPLTLSIGGQGDIGDVAGRAALVTAILDNDEAQANRLIDGLTQVALLETLRSHLHSGQSAVHVAVMFNRVWALKLLQRHGMNLSAPLYCNTDGQSPEMSWRHGTATEHRGCGLLGNSPWFEETSTECNSHGTDCRAVGIPVLYLATRYASLDALQYLTTHVEALSIGDKMRVILPPASVTARVSPNQQLASGVEGWLNVAHVACAYGELEILKWVLAQSTTAATAKREKVGLGRRPDLLLRDPRGRLAIHYCALADDPQLLGTLLSKSIVGSEERRAQLMARDDDGKTAEDLLSSRIFEEGHGRNRNTANVRQRNKRQHNSMSGAQFHGQRVANPTSWLQESLRVIQAANQDLTPHGDTTSRGARDDTSSRREPRLEQQQHQRQRLEL